jgi:hypothetical protein
MSVIPQLPLEIFDNIISFVNLDLDTLINFRQVSSYFKKATEEQYKIVKLYVNIFKTPKVDQNNILLFDEMCEHMSYLDLNNQFNHIDLINETTELIPLTFAKDIDNFIKAHNSIEYDIPCIRARGKASILLNNFKNYTIVNYLLYLGANPNCTTSKSEGYTIANFIMWSDLDINQKARLIALLIDYGMNIYLQDGDVGENTLFYLQEPELQEKVLNILELNNLDELVAKYD